MPRTYNKSGKYKKGPEDKYLEPYSYPPPVHIPNNTEKYIPEFKIGLDAKEILKRIEDKVNSLFVKYFPSGEINWEKTFSERGRVLNAIEDGMPAVPKKLLIAGEVYIRVYNQLGATIGYIKQEKI